MHATLQYPTRIHILGAGALGCLWAAYLQKNNRLVTFLSRPKNPSRTTVFTLEYPNGADIITVPSEDATEPGLITHLLVTLKAYDVLTAMASIAHRLHTHTTVILMQNGMGTSEEVQAAYPHLRLLHAVNYAGATRKSRDHIIEGGLGGCFLGTLSSESTPDHATIQLLTHEGFPVQWDNLIGQRLLEKCAINSIINPLGALFSCTNGALLTHKEAQAWITALSQEIEQLLTLQHKTCRAPIETLAREIMQKTFHNRCSMLQDLDQHKKTEIAYINGYFLQQAATIGLDMPYNRRLVDYILERT